MLRHGVNGALYQDARNGVGIGAALGDKVDHCRELVCRVRVLGAESVCLGDQAFQFGESMRAHCAIVAEPAAWAPALEPFSMQNAPAQPIACGIGLNRRQDMQSGSLRTPVKASGVCRGLEATADSLMGAATADADRNY